MATESSPHRPARVTALGAAWIAFAISALVILGVPGASFAPVVASAQTVATALGGNPAVLGARLSGEWTTLVAPTSPTRKPYSPECQALIDPGFTDEGCAIASGPGGTVAGVVEVELGLGPGGVASQERDLVWHQQGAVWSLALRRLLPGGRLHTGVWSVNLTPGRPELIFITASHTAGFGYELDVVAENGQVVLFRFLGGGFVVVSPPSGIVTYVPGTAERNGPAGAYDQMLLQDPAGIWQVTAEQYVPDDAALRLHHGVPLTVTSGR